MADRVVFHQTIVSPHMAGLASALAKQGHDVTYCATQLMQTDRAAQGWTAPDFSPARLELLPDAKAISRFLDSCPSIANH